MFKLRVPALLALSLLTLSACGNNTASTSSAPVTSSAVISASATASPTSSTKPSPAVASETPISVATTQVPMQTLAATPSVAPVAEATIAQPATQVAAPGTNCGNPAVTSAVNIYVSGGPISCDTAKSVVDEYNGIDKSTTPGVYGKATVQGYDCYTNTSVRNVIESRAGMCMNASNGGYIEVRPANVRVIPGPIDEVEKYETTSKTVPFYPAGSDGKLASSPYCNITSENVECSAFSSTQGVAHVIMAKDSAPVIKQIKAAPQAPFPGETDGKPVDIGTTLTAYGISCQPQGTQSIRCINATSGFTISMDGAVSE